MLLTWLLFFELGRIIFLVYHHSESSRLSFKTILQTFVHGFKMDLSMVGYVIAPVCLMVLISVFIPFFRKAILYKIYCGFLLFLFLLIVLVDLEIYNEWGYRLDSTIIQYLSSPGEAFASVGHLPVFLIFLVFALVYATLLLLFNRLINQTHYLLQATSHWAPASLVIIVFTVSLIIPIRGGFQMQPMNQSWVYFSNNNHANVSALNAPWNFLQDVFDKQKITENPYQFLSTERSVSIVDSLHRSSNTHQQLIDTSGNTNVILLIWESFTSKAMDTSINGKEVTPNFNRLKSEGIFFSNMYSSGDRTHKGMSAIFSGYPALPTISIIRYPKKSARLRLISNQFKLYGYNSTFYYGGDPDYDFYKSYLLQGGFDQIIGEDAFSSKHKVTEWGIHDGAVASHMSDDLKNWKEPFFHSWLTLTSHVPFKIPVSPAFKSDDNASKFFSSLYFTDSVVNSFIENCKKQVWWKNTVVIIVADHGHKLPETGKLPDDFKIPMLWLGGAVSENKGLVFDRVISQVDIATTLMKQMGWSSSSFPFSRNIVDTTAPAFAFFSNSTGFGFIQPGKYFVYDALGKRIRDQFGTITPKDVEAGKAMQQFIYDDYLKK